MLRMVLSECAVMGYLLEEWSKSTVGFSSKLGILS